MLKIFSFIGNLVLGKLTEAYKMRLDADNENGRVAADLAKKEIEERSRVAVAMLGNWLMVLPFFVIAMSLAWYVAKLLVWDKCLGWGSTDPLTGDLREWAHTIIYSMFGGGSMIATATILKR